MYMKKKSLFGSVLFLSGLSLTLTACGSNNQKNDATNEVKNLKSNIPVKPAKKGGHISVAVQSSSPFTGIFAQELAYSSTDAELMAPGNETLFDTNNTYEFDNTGAATIKFNQTNKTATIKIKKGVQWSDKEPLTAQDIKYSYLVLANPETQTSVYNSSLENIVGMSEYHFGKAKDISGIEMPKGPEGDTVVIHFKEMHPSMKYSGSGEVSETALPYHYLKNIPYKKLLSSDKIRKNPIFFGPFKMSKIVRGESVTYVRNDNYWRGKPNLDKITLSALNPDSTAQAIKSHKYDIADVVNSQWSSVKSTKGVKFVSHIPLAYTYLAFKVGKWDKNTGKNVMDTHSKMNNKSLRQAMAYAMNVKPVLNRYTHGLSFQVSTLIPKQFGAYYNPHVKPYTQDLSKANKLLDQAGYKKKGKYRVQPNGKPLTINLAAKAGDSTQEPIIQNYLQQWRKIGLNVKLTDGRLIEFNSFVQKIMNDDPKIDLYISAWGLSSEPSPTDLYGEKAQDNFGRFVTKKNNKLLAEMNSAKAFNESYRINKFHEWQQYMKDEAYVVPLSNSYNVTAINDRLTGYSTKPADTNTIWSKLGYVK